MNVQQVVKELGSTFSAVMAAMGSIGLKGRVVNGTRVWTPEDVAAIRKHLGK